MEYVILVGEAVGKWQCTVLFNVEIRIWKRYRRSERRDTDFSRRSELGEKGMEQRLFSPLPLQKIPKKRVKVSMV
jgi:hypothetical protein